MRYSTVNLSQFAFHIFVKITCALVGQDFANEKKPMYYSAHVFFCSSESFFQDLTYLGYLCSHPWEQHLMNKLNYAMCFVAELRPTLLTSVKSTPKLLDRLVTLKEASTPTSPILSSVIFLTLDIL
jgi:hypothetical protein